MAALRCRPGDAAMVTRPLEFQAYGFDWRLPMGAPVTVVALDEWQRWTLAERLPVRSVCGRSRSTISAISDRYLTPYRPWEQPEGITTAEPVEGIAHA